MTLNMASAQVVETSVATNSPSQDSNHPDDLFQSSYGTPGCKPFSYCLSIGSKNKKNKNKKQNKQNKKKTSFKNMNNKIYYMAAPWTSLNRTLSASDQGANIIAGDESISL